MPSNMRWFFLAMVFLGLAFSFKNCSSPVSPADPGVEGQAGCQFNFPGQEGRVQTEFAVFDGVLNSGVFAYKGLPYASPPVGNLRWQFPQNPSCSSQILKSQSFPPVCPQKTEQNGVISVAGDEDCLFLSIWAPRDFSRSKPVLVFIHGGGNQQGSASAEQGGVLLYEGQKMAERSGAVVVTLQYRLGALGYFVDESLKSPSGNLANYGLRDQQFALSWIQRNIEQFGGDPDRVLLFGESAGAVNTCMQLVSPRARGLFSAAAIQSGACMAKDFAEVQAFSSNLVSQWGCGGLAPSQRAQCLKGVSMESIVRQSVSDDSPLEGGVVATPLGPVVDNMGDPSQQFLPDEPLNLITRGLHNKVPVIVGSNSEETAPLTPLTVTRAMVQALAQQFLPYDSQLLALYNDPSPRNNYIAMTTDAQFTCNARRALRVLRQNQTEPVYQYVFSQPLPGLGSLGAFHGAELFYLFQKIEDIQTSRFARPADYDLEALMLNRWAEFADGGILSQDSALGRWPEFSSLEFYLDLNRSPALGRSFREAKCDLWDQITGQ